MTGRALRRVPWLAAAVLSVLASGCVSITQAPSPDAASPGLGGSPSPGEASPTGSGATGATMGPPVIGYISFGERVPFAREVSRSIRDEADRLGVELLACDSGLAPEGVRSCAEMLGEAGVAGAISFSAFPDLGAEVCAALGDVPVVGVAYDQGPCQVSAVGTDNHASGVLAGEALGRFSQQRWDCEIDAWVSLESSAAGALGAERMAGYRDGYERHCEIPEDSTTVLDGTDRVVTAERQVADLLEEVRGRRIIVVGLNEDAVAGALAAARGAGREDDVWVSGQGADPSARRSIACDRHYVASVAHLPERFGEVLVPTVLAAVEGRDVPARVDTPIELVSGNAIRELYPATPACEDASEDE